MRAIITSAAFLSATWGSIVMSDALTADDKKKTEKHEKKFFNSEKTYTEQVTVKVWVEQGKRSLFLKPVPDVWAAREDHKGKDGTVTTYFCLYTPLIGSPVRKKTIITDAAGNEYECVGDGRAAIGEPFPVKLVKKATAPEPKP